MNNKLTRKTVKWIAAFCLISTFAVAQDADSDGVLDASDRCPGTASGVTVNTFGCPTTATTCDGTGDETTISFTSGTMPAGATTKYIAVNSATGNIVAVSDTREFLGLPAGNVYMVMSYSYTGTLSGLAVDSPLSGVTSSECLDFSNALTYKICTPATIPSIKINDITVNEEDGTAELTVTLSAPTTVPITFKYTTVNGTALSTTDYTSSTGTLVTIPAGSTTATITIPIKDDQISEITETFDVILSDPTGATIEDGKGVVTILDKDFTFITPTSCTFTGTSFTLTTATTPPTTGTTKYVLVDATGKITHISDTPTFSGFTGTTDVNAYAISYLDPSTVSNLQVGKLFSDVSGTCFDWSNTPFSVRICTCEPKCLPVTVTRIK